MSRVQSSSLRPLVLAEADDLVLMGKRHENMHSWQDMVHSIEALVGAAQWTPFLAVASNLVAVLLVAVHIAGSTVVVVVDMIGLEMAVELVAAGMVSLG